MGIGISSLPALQRLGINGGTPDKQRGGSGGGIGFGAQLAPRRDETIAGPLGQRIEQNLMELLAKAEANLTENRAKVLALAHGLEQHKTLTGEDVIAILEGRQGPLVDGRPYLEPDLIAELETYHEEAVEAHRRHAAMGKPLPSVANPKADEPTIVQGEIAAMTD
jgi:cell division protease FtsH